MLRGAGRAILTTVVKRQSAAMSSGKDDFRFAAREANGPLVLDRPDTKQKNVDALIDGALRPPEGSTVPVRVDETAEISGVPEEHQWDRVARISKPAREATQTAWANTKVWKIELDNRQRWENPLMGWSSTSDPLSNISMNLDFASKEDAIAFCRKNNWQFEVEEPQERAIKAKSYGWNYAWNRRTRVSTK